MAARINHNVFSEPDQTDKDLVQAIERREINNETSRMLSVSELASRATADAKDYLKIRDGSWQQHAAVQIAENARNSLEYRKGFESAVSQSPGTVEHIAGLDAAHTELVGKKDERKASEAIAMLEARAETARRWTSEEAATAAARDVQTYRTEVRPFEHAFQRDDMAANAAENQSYRIALKAAVNRLAPRTESSFNTLEPDIQKQIRALDGVDEERRSAWLKMSAPESKGVEVTVTKPSTDNKVESDEIFTATQRDVKPVVPPDVAKRYLQVGEKFYHPQNTDLVAFEDKGNKLETKSSSENIAASMVRIAEARGWDEIKVSGSEGFRKEVWLEAASRGMHVKGYTASDQDKAALAMRSTQIAGNRLENDPKPFRARENDLPSSPDSKSTDESNRGKRLADSLTSESPASAVKKYPELAGAVAVLAVIDKRAEADGLNAAQRAIVSARVRQNLVNSIERGDVPQVTIRDDMEVKQLPKEKEYAR